MGVAPREALPSPRKAATPRRACVPAALPLTGAEARRRGPGRRV